MQMMRKIPDFFKNKWVLTTSGMLGVAAMMFFFLMPEKPKPEIQTQSPTSIPALPTNPPRIQPSPTRPDPTTTVRRAPNTFTPEQMKTIEEQVKADEAVGKREVEIRTSYPWFFQLPARGEKHFAYFDTNKKVFVGLLYPKSGDNLDQIKAAVRKQLIDVIKIPAADIDRYGFEWTVKP